MLCSRITYIKTAPFSGTKKDRNKRRSSHYCGLFHIIREKERGLMNIKILPAYDFQNETAELFTEYTSMLIENDAEFKKYLEIQNYDDELKDLKVKYGMPQGRLYIAFDDNRENAAKHTTSSKAAGCIGLKRIDDTACEMKRLYVRPEFRGKDIGRILVQKIIDDAKAIGYSYMLLDTLPFLKSALRIYREFGFYEIESYNDSPMSTSIYMRLDL